MKAEDSISRLSELTTQALAEGRAADVFDYWCELAEMVAALTIETRGWSEQVPADNTEAWLMGVSVSSMTDLCEVCDLARPGRPQNEPPRVRLRDILESTSGADPAARAARVLALATLAVPELDASSVALHTAELLEAAIAAAKEFEESWSPEAFQATLAREDPSARAWAERDVRRAFFLYVRDRPQDYWNAHATVALLGEPVPPGTGETARALDHCVRLAQGRLWSGPSMSPLHPRYRRGWTQFYGGMSRTQKSIRRLSDALNRTCATQWWFGTAEYLELSSQDSCTASFAGWLRTRCREDPRSISNPPPADPDPAQQVPDFICDWWDDGTSLQEQQHRFGMYQRAGISWYWIVDLPRGVLRVLRLAGGEYLIECTAEAKRRVAFPPFHSAEIDLETVFFP